MQQRHDRPRNTGEGLRIYHVRGLLIFFVYEVLLTKKYLKQYWRINLKTIWKIHGSGSKKYSEKQEEAVSCIKDAPSGYDVLNFFGYKERFSKESDRMEEQKYHLTYSQSKYDGVIDAVEQSLLSNPDLALILTSQHLMDEGKQRFDQVYELEPAAFIVG